MLKNRFEILLKRKLKKMVRRLEHTKIFVERNDKSRKSDSEKINENKFLYKQFFNVKNDDSVQSTIDRNDYKNKNKDREYRENRRRENEISRDKTKKSKNNNVIDLSKIAGLKCRQKNIMFVIAQLSNPLTNRKKNKVDQCYFDYINSNCQKQKCFTSFFHFNNALCKHYHDHSKSDDR